MKSVIELQKESMWIIMDNSSIHWFSSFVNYLNEKHLTWIYLPHYTPELAPVELFFGMLKRLISKRKTNTIINISRESGTKILIEELELIDLLSIMRIWKHYLFTLKGIVCGIDFI